MVMGIILTISAVCKKGPALEIVDLVPSVLKGEFFPPKTCSAVPPLHISEAVSPSLRCRMMALFIATFWLFVLIMFAY